MSALWSIISEFLQPFMGYISGGIVIILCLWGKSKMDKRRGRKEERMRREAADAKETIKAHEVRDDVEDDIARGGSAKQRLRERWRKG